MFINELFITHRHESQTNYDNIQFLLFVLYESIHVRNSSLRVKENDFVQCQKVIIKKIVDWVLQRRSFQMIVYNEKLVNLHPYFRLCK
jgi:hypothetical protein